MGDDGAGQGPDQCADEGVGPLPWVEQLALVEGEAGRRRAEGRTEFVGAQDQVGWQACGQQRRGGQQSAATGNGIDETGNEGDNGKNSEGSEVNAEFKRHGMGLFGRSQKGCGKAGMLPIMVQGCDCLQGL